MELLYLVAFINVPPASVSPLSRSPPPPSCIQSLYCRNASKYGFRLWGNKKKTPLLAWDLTTLLVAGVSMSRTWADRAGAARAACLARLCQTLIQPEMCLRGAGRATSAAVAESGWGRSGPRGQVRLSFGCIPTRKHGGGGR